MAVVPKADGQVCVDLTKLNEHVCCKLPDSSFYIMQFYLYAVDTCVKPGEALLAKMISRLLVLA